MTPDLSRDSYNYLKGFTRVIQQQGRVQLDADWNEQADIVLGMIRRMFMDLVGPYAAPPDPKDASDPLTNFKIGVTLSNNQPTDLTIGAGHYYVHGIACENVSCGNVPGATYLNQPYLDVTSDPKIFPNLPFLVYLDVWEETVTALDDPSIREPALGGPDTAARTKVKWAVRAAPIAVAPTSTATAAPSTPAPSQPGTAVAAHAPTSPSLIPKPGQEFQGLPPTSPASDSYTKTRGLMRAHVGALGTTAAADLCAIAPAAQYSGTENQLYRVEIHSGGVLDVPPGTASTVPAPTFKWSRDNGTVAFVITAIGGSDSPWTITLQDFGRDSRFSLDVGDWVEIVMPSAKLQDGAAPADLLRVTAIDPIDRTVTVEGPLPKGVTGVPQPVSSNAAQPQPVSSNAAQPQLLRRWDQRLDVTGTKTPGGPPLGVIPITTLQSTTTDTTNSKKPGGNPDDTTNWFELEDGIRVQFQSPAHDSTSVSFRAGDFWLIPARTASNGSILWPTDKSDTSKDPSAPPVPKALHPRGIQRYYAPLAYVIDPTTRQPATDPSKPENWAIDCRTKINRSSIVTGP